MGSPQPSGAWLGGDARPNGRAYSADEIRQYRREYQERVRQAEDLRRVLADAGASTRDLNDVINQLRGFDSDKLYNDPRALQELQAAALDRLKKFEFDLRKKIGSDNNQLGLSGSDEVPAAQRQNVEEYFRKLSQTGTR